MKVHTRTVKATGHPLHHSTTTLLPPPVEEPPPDEGESTTELREWHSVVSL